MQEVRNYTRTARGRRYKMLQTSFAEIRRGKKVRLAILCLLCNGDIPPETDDHE